MPSISLKKSGTNPTPDTIYPRIVLPAPGVSIKCLMIRWRLASKATSTRFQDHEISSHHYDELNEGQSLDYPFTNCEPSTRYQLILVVTRKYTGVTWKQPTNAPTGFRTKPASGNHEEGVEDDEEVEEEDDEENDVEEEEAEEAAEEAEEAEMADRAAEDED